jgi:hypothetical protein
MLPCSPARPQFSNIHWSWIGLGMHDGVGGIGGCDVDDGGGVV